MSRSLTQISQLFDSLARCITLEFKKMLETIVTAYSVPIGATKRIPYTGDTVGAAPAIGMIGFRLAALGILAVAGPAALQAQVGLASRTAQIALIARSPSHASINGVSPAQETARRGSLREGTVKVRLSANTGYRLVVVGTAAVSSNADPASRLWVRAENGRFEEVRSGAAVTVTRGHHAGAASEPEVTFRSETSASGRDTDVLPVRYEIRIEPTI